MKDLSTKFAPPPQSFSRSTYISSSPKTAKDDAASAEAGYFAMSLRGLRRTLRLSTGPRTRRGDGGRTEEILEIMERELGQWLGMSGRIPEGFYHDSTAYAGASLRQAVSRGKLLDPTPLDDVILPREETLPDLPTSTAPSQDDVPTLTELARQPHTLVWLAPSSHHRFLLHCLARYYDLSSFSRPLSPLEPDVRVTHVLRPQLVRPRPAGAGGSVPDTHGVETPPGTDWSTAAGSTTEGELTAADTLTDVDETASEFTAEEDVDDEDGEDDRGSVEAEPIAVQRPEAVAAVAGGTDDEAEAVYSSATDSERGSDDTGVDSLASSFADLAAAAPPGTPPPQRSGIATPAFVAVDLATDGSATPTPLARPSFAPSPLSLLGSASATPRPVDAVPRGRLTGRRSLPAVQNGYSSAESSPSRSPTRAAAASARGTYVGTTAGEWKMPSRAFVDWIYE